jgi:hypothetical protein
MSLILKGRASGSGIMPWWSVSCFNLFLCRKFLDGKDKWLFELLAATAAEDRTPDLIPQEHPQEDPWEDLPIPIPPEHPLLK